MKKLLILIIISLSLLVLPTVFGTIHYYNTFKHGNLTDWYCVNKTMTIHNSSFYESYLEISQIENTTDGFCYYDSPQTYNTQVDVSIDYSGYKYGVYVDFLDSSTPVGKYPFFYSNTTTWYYFSDDYMHSYCNGTMCNGGGWQYGTGGGRFEVAINFTTGLHWTRRYYGLPQIGTFYKRSMLDWDKVVFTMNGFNIETLCIADGGEECNTCPEKWIQYNISSIGCNISDSENKMILYYDYNDCGTKYNFPINNGTKIKIADCNYCSEDIQQYFTTWSECTLPAKKYQRTEYYIDNNFNSCCNITARVTDCHINNGSYSSMQEESSCTIRYKASDIPSVFSDVIGEAGVNFKVWIPLLILGIILTGLAMTYSALKRFK